MLKRKINKIGEVLEFLKKSHGLATAIAIAIFYIEKKLNLHWKR